MSRGEATSSRSAPLDPARVTQKNGERVKGGWMIALSMAW